MAQVMWKFRTKNFTVQWKIAPDDLSTAYMEPSLAEECRRKVRSRQWKCFQSEVTVIHNGTRFVLGETFIGNSIYANPKDFRDHFGMSKGGYGSYFRDMVLEAIRQARSNFPELQRQARNEVQVRQKLIAIRLRSPKQLCAAR